jgi:Flp pilus assembly protein TadG
MLEFTIAFFLILFLVLGFFEETTNYMNKK